MLHVVVTARPSWARVKTLVQSYSEINGKDSIAVITLGPAASKRYGEIGIDIPQGLKNYIFHSLQESDEFGSIALSSLMGGQDLARFWGSNRPDMALVIADRTETLGVSVTASLMQIPLIHLQGGEVSGSIDDKVRDANSKLSDLHLTTNLESKKRLLDIGEPSNRIFVCGCPSIDLVLKEIETKSEVSSAASYGGVGADFSLDNQFGIIMFHPDTLDSDENNVKWIRTLSEFVVSQKGNKFNWFWFWPNPDHGTHLVAKTIRGIRENSGLTGVRFLVNILPEHFIRIANRSSILIGNSSFGIREASFMGLPTINIGNRQRNRQRAVNVLDVLHPEDIKMLSDVFEDRCSEFRLERSTLYGDGHSGERAAQLISAWPPSLKQRH